jgi:hypothetical protein
MSRKNTLPEGRQRALSSVNPFPHRCLDHAGNAARFVVRPQTEGNTKGKKFFTVSVDKLVTKSGESK